MEQKLIMGCEKEIKYINALNHIQVCLKIKPTLDINLNAVPITKSREKFQTDIKSPPKKETNYICFLDLL